MSGTPNEPIRAVVNGNRGRPSVRHTGEREASDLVRRLLLSSVVAVALAGCASSSQVTSLSQPSPDPTTSALTGSPTGSVFPQPVSTTTTAASPPPASPASNDAAAMACTIALGEGVVSAVATTVAAIRAWGIGPVPVYFPAAHAFPGESGDAFAAWCWVGSGGRFASWGVDGRGAKIEFGAVIDQPGDSSTPSGGIGIGS
jgi:hypothetical protein